MGRIEDALAKLRSQRSEANPPATENRGIGRLSSSVEQPLPAGAHRYGGRSVLIDHDQLRRQGLLAPAGQERQLADEYALVKRPLLANASAGRDPPLPEGNLMMVASATSGEGKTFTCINLCLSIAREQDWSVVLVDGDCTKPHVSQLFGAEGQPGLMDLLQDNGTSFDSLVMETDIPCFAIMPAGKRSPLAAELLASARMRSLCAEVSKADPRRMIVFDSAPLLLTAEAPVLASQVGQVLVVVHASKTPQGSVLEALARLDPSKPINLLLNQSTSRTAATKYGDYYGSAG